MKELTIEEKAKAYDEAFRIAQELYNSPNSSNIGKGYVCTVFPELKESEDEKIKKQIKAFIKSRGSQITQSKTDAWIAWLEKQGEKEPADKVEPKFHEGYWTVSNLDGKARVISEVHFDEYNSYYVVNGKSVNLEEYDRLHHLWTIQDAKDGDVLFTSSTASHETFIFKNIDERGNVKCYFAYDSEDGFREGKYHFIGRATNCKPATKEQRDALMKAMADAGYTFDFEKKKLKKIVDEDKIKKNLQGNSFRRMFEQNTIEWSKEDERIYQSIIDDTVQENQLDTKQIYWIKSIKDRIQH